MAGATAVLFTYPVDLIRVRLAVEVKEPRLRGVTHALSSIFRQEGVRGLFRGVNPTLLVCRSAHL